jgi:threonyl-tRNA synthetase
VANSGHEENYADSLFEPMGMPAVFGEDTEFRPATDELPRFHIGIYKSHPHSYRELPLRYCRTRNGLSRRLSGALHGLLRVRDLRRTTLIFSARPNRSRRKSAAAWISHTTFSALSVLKIQVELSVRGAAENKGYLGSNADWENAECALINALSERGIGYERIEGEAAFTVRRLI